MEVKDLKPELLWRCFDEITKVPRPSCHEEQIRAYLLDFAAKHGIEAQTDDCGNVVMRKPATAGCENAPTVILQAHMDMVAEKNNDVKHDFLKDPIDTYVDGDWVKARGTTLGADNGIGMAAALAVMIDKDLRHGPVEALFTINEEIGLEGAQNLGKNMITGTMLINLDSEDDGEIFVGCAGGIDTTAFFKYKRSLSPENFVYKRISVSGLLGGHSGSDINLERGNGNLIMARIIDRLMVAGEPAIVSFNGGTKDNAINRECKAVLVYADHAAAEAAAQIAKGIIADVTAELEVFDPGFTCTVEIADNTEVEAMDEKSALALIRALRLAPNGVIRRNVATDGSVEVSSNIGVVATSDDQVKIMLSPRSSITSLQNEFKDRLQTLADVLGFDAKFEFEYPGWSYAEHSPVRDVFVESYRELFGSELRIESIHAGLECGLFAEALHGLDAIAVGPTLSDVHTPDESMELASAERFYELLIDVLKRLAA